MSIYLKKIDMETFQKQEISDLIIYKIYTEPNTGQIINRILN